MRLERIQKKIKKNRLDGFLVTNPKNVYYLSNFSGTGIKLLLKEKEALFFSGPLYYEEAKETVEKSFKLVRDFEAKFFRGLKRIGIEENSLYLKDYFYLQKLLPGIKFIPCRNFIEDFRSIKEEAEIELLKKSARITRNVFSSLLKELKPGMSELKVANRVRYSLREKGAEDESFPPIVASGVRSSFPHALPSKKIIEEKEPIILDFGGSFQRYQSDFTRTIFLGKIGRKESKLKRLLKKAQDLAMAKIRPGVMISEIDQAARHFLEGEGYGKYFIHSLGHGVGLNVHELPLISSKNRKRLKPGMVFTLEPGVYIPGWGGLRREDMVVVTKTGCKKL